VRGQTVSVTPTAFPAPATVRPSAEPLLLDVPTGWSLTNSPTALIHL
jgi:hypothetical protein